MCPALLGIVIHTQRWYENNYPTTRSQGTPAIPPTLSLKSPSLSEVKTQIDLPA